MEAERAEENPAPELTEALEAPQIEPTTTDYEEKAKSSDLAITRLQDELKAKTAVITNLENEVSRLVSQNKSFENSVIKFAITEKSVLDARNARDAAEKKLLNLQREIDLMNNKIKASAADKTRILGILDEKCHEVKVEYSKSANLTREIDRLKHEITTLDSKVKWHASKLKCEAELRETSEKKIEELTAEINLLKTKEINRAKEELDIERNMLAEKQMIEQNAVLILLKHDNEEKTRRIEALEGLNVKCAELSKQLEAKTKGLEEATLQISDSQNLIDKQMLKIAELQSNQNDLEIIRTQLSIAQESNRSLKDDLKTISAQIEEQNLETEKWKKTEIGLLQLNQEISESLVEIKNESSMLQSKLTAVILENEILKKEKSYFESQIHDHQEEIRKRNSDCQLLAKHLSEKTKCVNTLQQKIEEITGDLEAQQKKHLQAVKEMTRELNGLRKKSADTSNVPAANNGPNTTKSASEEYPSISLEPSQKSLIDRICRLQNEIVRQSEKIDFLENHQAQLLEELKRLRKK